MGCGFAVFESLGYSLQALIEAGNTDAGISALRTTTIFRGICSPFCHIVWTAVAGAALWRVCDGVPKFKNLFAAKFLRLFAIPVVFHMLWNYSVEEGWLFFVVLPIEAILIWKIVFALADAGIKEVRIVRTPRLTYA